MTALPLSIGVIHFIGIGGIGMSGIAEILFEMGYSVQGSDSNESANVERLRKRGIEVMTPQHPDNLREAALTVISTAINDDNVELLEARRRFLPVVHRAEMLGELMRLRWSVAVAGTHGKTTTTSIVSTLLHAAGIDPTVINGGVISSFGSNARLGSGDWMVVEADESDGSFSRLKPTVAIVTNIDPEHLDHHGSVEKLEAAFSAFVASVPFYGFASLCIDHPAVQKLLPGISDRRLITYGLSTNADVRAVNLSHNTRAMQFDVQLSERLGLGDIQIDAVQFPMLGEHNVLNCLAAISVGIEMGIDIPTIRMGLEQFRGVSRRFDVKGEVDGITIIDDYGHHPVEIKATLSAARMRCTSGRIIAIVQPHRYSRLHDLFEDFCACFNDADEVYVTDVFAAGEAPIAGCEKDDLAAGLRAHGHRNANILETADELPEVINRAAGSGDLVVCLGAGTISKWAAALPEQLEALKRRGGAA